MFSFYRLLEEIDKEIKNLQQQVTKSPEQTKVSSNKPQYQPNEIPTPEDKDTTKLGYGNSEEVKEQTGIANTDNFNMGDKVPATATKSLSSANAKALVNMSPYKGRNVKEKSKVSLPSEDLTNVFNVQGSGSEATGALTKTLNPPKNPAKFKLGGSGSSPGGTESTGRVLKPPDIRTPPRLARESWFSKLSDKAKLDPTVRDHYKKYAQHIMGAKFWHARKDKGFARQDLKAGQLAKYAALSRAKQLSAEESAMVKLPDGSGFFVGNVETKKKKKKK